MREADVILSTLTDRITVLRADSQNPTTAPHAVYRDLPCALSRTATVTAPDPHDPHDSLAECAFRATLFLPAQTDIRAGDQAEVTRHGMHFSGVLSPSIPYPSHTVAVMYVWEVKAV